MASYIYISQSTVKRKRLESKGLRFIWVFSFLFAANIAVGVGLPLPLLVPFSAPPYSNPKAI